MKRHPITKQALQVVPDGKTAYYYAPLPQARPDGVVAVLAGYRKQGKDHWFK